MKERKWKERKWKERERESRWGNQYVGGGESRRRKSQDGARSPERMREKNKREKKKRKKEKEKEK